MPRPTTANGTTRERRGRTGHWSRIVAALMAGLLILSFASAADAKTNNGNSKHKSDSTSQTASLADTSTTSTSSTTSHAEIFLLDAARAVGATNLWAQGITGAGIDVAVSDTGVAPVPGLAGSEVVVGPDLSFEAASDEVRGLDTYGHGTHIAGIIGATTPGADPASAKDGDTFGIAPGARIVSLKVGDSTGAVDVSQVIAAIDWVVANRTANGLDIRVLNLSYNTSSLLEYGDDPLARAVENAWDAGIVVVVAAGNDGRGVKELANPANDPYVIAVGAAGLDSNGKWVVPSWGTRGDGIRNPDVVAPGVSLASLRVPGSRIDAEHPSGLIAGHDDLFKGSGTSQAAAVVSGAAALLLDADPTLTPDEVKATLMATATDIHPDETRQGWGLIDIDYAARVWVVGAVRQHHTASKGLGLIEAARGEDHVTLDGTVLQGEITFNGSAWDGPAWVKASADGSTWSGDLWVGSPWTGSPTSTDSSWTGSSWTGSSWTGSSWTGSSWTGSSWTGSSWTGSSWTGSSWTGSSWTGSSWTGSSWTGHGWQ